MKGNEVKTMIQESGVKLWQVAHKLGVNDGNFSRRLRREFTEDEVRQVEKIILEIKMCLQ